MQSSTTLLRTIGLGSIAGLLLGSGAMAQEVAVTDFEDATKSSYTAETKVVNGLSWFFHGANIGNQDGDMRIGSKAARMRQVDSFNATLELQDPLENISAVSFYYARANFSGDRTGVSPVIVVAVGDGSSWTSLDTLNLTGVDELTLASYSDIEPGYSYFKIYAIAGDNGKRFNIDSIAIEYNGEASGSLGLVYKTPVGMGVSLSTSELTAKFSDQIQKGEGNIYLYKEDGTLAQSIDVSSVDVSIDDSTAIIGGIVLENATAYYVNMDAGVFAKLGAPGITNNAITSSTEWTFATVDTTPVPPITSLNESFVECLNPALGAFRQYSVEGSRTWVCNNFGHDDAHAVSINGGTAAGVSSNNKDYLITNAQLDLTSYEDATLSFWHAKRFEGEAVLKIKISYDYEHGNNPDDETYTWTEIYTMDVPEGNDEWSYVSDISLTEYASAPFYLAFYYECGTDGTFEYKLDDIVVAGTNGVKEAVDYNRNLVVLGQSTRSQINLRLTAHTTGIYQLQVYDINGKCMTTEILDAQQGINDYSIQNLSLNSGIYLIRVQNAENGQVSTAKTVVQ